MVQLTADTVTMENGASIVTATADGRWHWRGCASTRASAFMGGSSIQSQSQTVTPDGLGQGGNVTIQGLRAKFGAAKSYDLSGDSFLLSSSFRKW